MILLLLLAAAGSTVAAARPGQPEPLRVAHGVMAVAMLAMLGPEPFMVIGLALLAGVVPVVVGHWVLHRSGLPCAIDLAGMALLLAAVLGGAQSRVVLLVALGWAIASVWAHAEAAWSARRRTPILAEAGVALIGVLAMALMVG